MAGANAAKVLSVVTFPTVTKYDLLSADALATAVRVSPRLNWPTDQMEVGDAFVIPMVNGFDPDGRPEANLRVYANKHGQRLGRKFSCRKVEGGLAIIRTA